MKSKIFTVVMSLFIAFSAPANSATIWKNPAQASYKSGASPLTPLFKKKLSQVVLNGLEEDLVLHENNVHEIDKIKFVKKDGRHAINIFMTYEDIGPDDDWKRHGIEGFAQRTQLHLAKNRLTQKNTDKWYRLSYWLEGDNHSAGHQLSILDLPLRKGDHSFTGVGFNYSSRQNRVGFDFVQDVEAKRGTDGALDFPRFQFRLDKQHFGNDFNNRWVDIVFNIKWSPDGHTRIWVDGQLVTSLPYGPRGGKKTKQYGFKFGPYRNSMPYGERAPDLNIFYSDIGISDSCEQILENCEALKKQITKEEYLAKLKEPEVCFQRVCTAYPETETQSLIESQTPKLPFPKRFIGRGIWQNSIKKLTYTTDMAKGVIDASTIIKHKSPVRNVVFSFEAMRDQKKGYVSFISGKTNDGRSSSAGDFVEYFHSEADAELIYNECGVVMLKLNDAYYPSFNLQEALDISFERFGHNLELFSEKSKCQIYTLDAQHPEYWYELLHLAGKSLRGSFEKGNTAPKPEIAAQFAEFQKEVKGWR